jgi:LysR family transcriptional regulator, regulator of abg operon
MKPQHVEMILTIAEAGSIRAAADAMGRTQPALTKALRQAEDALGSKIFRRSARGVTATEAGHLVIARARVIRSEMARLSEELHQIKGDLTGNLSLIVSPLTAARIIPDAMQRFRTRFALVHVQLTGGNAPAAFGPLRVGEADFVIGPAPDPDAATGLTVEALFKTPIALLTGTRSRYRDATRLEALADAEWLMIGPKDRVPLIWSSFNQLGLPAPAPMTTSDSIISILSMLENSDRICTFPALLAADLETRWQVARIPIKTPIDPVQIALTHAADRPLTPAGRFLRDCILASAARLQGQM